MITATSLRHYRPALVIPLLVTGFWLFSHKGCVPDPDQKPTPALAVAAIPIPLTAPRVGPPGTRGNLAGPGAPPSSGNTAKSLTRAADMLKQAATLLDKNEHLAVQLIRQAIAILKHDVMHALTAPEPDKVSAEQAELLLDERLKSDTGPQTGM